MLVTSALIPPAATWHRLSGMWRHRRAPAWRGGGRMSPVKAVLFDRDGTLVHDVPYNGDPERVRPVEGAREAVALLRAHDIRTGVVTNQSGVARGLISDADVRHVNRRIDDLVGPFDVWAICPHGPDDGCHCRKPQPGLVLWAAGRVCTAPRRLRRHRRHRRRHGGRRTRGRPRHPRPQRADPPGGDGHRAHVAPDLLTAVRAVLAGPPKGRILADERPIGAAFRTRTAPVRAPEAAPSHAAAETRGRPR